MYELQMSLHFTKRNPILIPRMIGIKEHTDIMSFMIELDSLMEFLHLPLYITMASANRISIVPISARWFGFVETGSVANIKLVNRGLSFGSSAVP